MKPLTVIAWDTATAWCTAALERFEADGSVTRLGRFEEEGGGAHSQVLPEVVERLLKEAGLKPAELDLAAVGRGPGSFTGLRTGLALAKGLALGAGIAIMGFSSLEILAADILKKHPSALAAPVIDARHQQVFTALYEAGAEGRPVMLAEPAPVAPSDFGDHLAAAAKGRAVTAAGPALGLIPESGLGPGAAGDASIISPSASTLAALAASVFRAEGAAVSDYPPIPLYARQPDIRRSGLTFG